MPVSRHKHEDLQDRYRRLADTLEETREERQAFREAARRAALWYADADAANKRLRELNAILAEQINLARADYTALEQRLERALQACARYRAELATAAARLHGPLVTNLHRSERARAALDGQCRNLQAANEAMARELRDIHEKTRENAA